VTANHTGTDRAGAGFVRPPLDEPGAIEFLPNYAMQVVTDAVEQIIAAADDMFVEHPPGAHAAHELGSRPAYVTLEWLREYPS
jgi:hypothetical protein